MALRLVLFILAVLILWFCVMQIVIPLFGGRPLFPAFRREDKGVKRLREEVNDLHQEVDIMRDVNELTATRDTLVREKSKLDIASNDWTPQESNPANPKQ